MPILMPSRRAIRVQALARVQRKQADRVYIGFTCRRRIPVLSEKSAAAWSALAESGQGAHIIVTFVAIKRHTCRKQPDHVVAFSGCKTLMMNGLHYE
jgi:hypothetical protein